MVEDLEGGGEVWMSGGKVDEDSFRGRRALEILKLGRSSGIALFGGRKSEQCCPLAKDSRPKGVGGYNAAKAKVLQPS